MRNRMPLLTLALALSGCGANRVDCDALAKEQPACMDEGAIEACEAANALCEERGGDVHVLESCPLQFACSG